LNDLSLANNDFYDLLNSLDPELSTQYSILLHRLLHPSGMVKERTCSSLAKLLLHDDFSDTISSLLSQWIISQKLEIHAVYGLLAYIKAKISDDSYDLVNLVKDFDEMKSPSLLFEDLLKAILTRYVPFYNFPMHSNSSPESYELDSFFMQYGRRFILPNLRYTIRYNNDYFPSILFKQWCYESDLLIDKTGYVPNLDALDYIGRPDMDHHVSFNSILSDIYTSSYLRAIAWAKSKGLSSENARKKTLQTCPINLGLWKINPSPKPTFWPNIDNSSVLPVDIIWNQVSELWKNHLQQDWVFGFIDGRIGCNESYYDLVVYAFLENKDIKLQNSAEVLFPLLANHQVLNDDLSYNCEGKIQPNGASDTGSDSILDVIPLSSMFFNEIDSHWQFWRQERLIHFPSVYLIESPMKYSCLADGIHFTEQLKLIAKWNDWVDGITERRDSNLSLRTGNKLEISKTKLESLQGENQFNYGWVCQITEYNKKNYLTYDLTRYYKKYI